jgi:dihydrolipoamide dehydrogenase
MSDNVYDLVVIGGGPGGYVAAIKAAQLGMKVACVEKRSTLGGCCLNIGCIPSKALLHSSELYEKARNGLTEHGVKVDGVSFDLNAMLDHKDRTVEQGTEGLKFLFKKNKIEHLHGTGRLAGEGRAEVKLENGETRELQAKHIVIATGSEVTPLPGVEIDEERIVSSTGALELEKVPEHMVVVGGGYIGLEMGTVWRRLGSKVTVVEFLDRITPGLDGEVSKQFQRILKRQGLEFQLSTKVTGVDKADRLTVTTEPAKGGDGSSLECDIVLVSIGRRPFTGGLGLETLGIETDNAGRIKVDEWFATSAKGVYAIGDVIHGPMLAHKAEDDGKAVAEIIAGQKPHIDYNLVPAVVYTHPEVASVGQTEEQLKESGIAYNVGKYPFSANPRARGLGQTDGFVKILADKATDRVLGCHIVGPEAGTLIAEVTLAMAFGASSEDIARTSHAHPTLEEAVKEAAMAAHGKPIHM